jgi:hypothetical protein
MMLAALLLVSSITSGGVLQLTHAQYGGEEIHVRPTGDSFYFICIWYVDRSLYIVSSF